MTGEEAFKLAMQACKETWNEKSCAEIIKALEQEPCDKCVYSTKDGYCQYDDITETIPPFEPCEDAVSRQAAIDACLNGWNKDYKKIVADIRQLPSVVIPSAEPKTGWIPVNERLPEEAFGCIVTVWDTNPMTMNEFENILPYFVGWDGEQWNDADGEQCPFEVIAWMPLSEPYKEG